MPDQRSAYNEVDRLISAKKPGILFLDAPEGTGKTFFINLIFAKVRSQQKIAFAAASSGIAATLFTGERTAHSMFKLPLKLTSSD